MTTPANTPASPTRRPAVSVRSALTAGAVAALISSVVNVAIALVARGPLGVGDEFVPLTPGPIVLWTVIGALVGAAGWRMIVNRSARSAALLRRLVPTVLAVSFIPDVALLVTRAMPGTTTAGVVSLMVMHLVTAAIAVTAYRRAMPPA